LLRVWTKIPTWRVRWCGSVPCPAPLGGPYGGMDNDVAFIHLRRGVHLAGNLTRGEARDRARLLTVESYNVDLDLTTGPETFVSDTTVRFGCADPGSSTFVDLHGAKVREVTLNGQSLDPGSYDPDKGRIPLPRLAAANELRVVADATYSRTGEGLHRFVEPVLMARLVLSVTASADWLVIS